MKFERIERSKYQIVIYFTEDENFNAAFFINKKGAINTNFNPAYYCIHCKGLNEGYNGHTIPIAVDYDKNSESQRDSLKELLVDLCDSFDIPKKIINTYDYNLKNATFEGIVFDSNVNKSIKPKFLDAKFDFFVKKKVKHNVKDNSNVKKELPAEK